MGSRYEAKRASCVPAEENFVVYKTDSIDQGENSKSCDFNGWIQGFLVEGRPRGR